MNLARGVRVFLAAEAILFFGAAIAHFGSFIDRTQDGAAGTAETVIGLVILGGLIITVIKDHLTRTTSLAVQAFALLGTMIGIFTIIIGVGPNTTTDIIIHTMMVTLLVSGLVVAQRADIRHLAVQV